MIYVHHHLGLGDHIVCNAIVRNIYKKYGKLTLAVKNQNYSSVRNLYSDINIDFHLVNNDNDCLVKYKEMPFIRIGFENCRSDWEQSFYDQVKLPYSTRYSDFYIKRNYFREETLKKILNLPEDYAFCNTTASSGKYNISIKSRLHIIQLSPYTDSIFDWIPVIEGAKEIHTIDSSVFQLIKQLPTTKEKFFYDIRELDKTRTIPTFEDSNWEIIKL